MSLAAGRPKSLQGKRPATLGEVAKLAGVSITTASRALSGHGRMAAETRASVKAAAQTLRFSPNPLAQGLLAGRSSTIGLLTSDLEGRFSIPVLMGAEDALGAKQFAVFLSNSRGDVVLEQQHLHALLARRVDGVMVVASDARLRPSLGRDLLVPIVYALGESEDPADTSVVVDNVQAGRTGVEHLVGIGRRRIAYIGGDIGLKGAADRAAGARSALAAAGLDFVSTPLFGPWNEEWGRAAAHMLLERGADFDGVLCGSDHIARGVLDTLRDEQLDVPKDVAVLGHDNFYTLAAHSRPTLSSIDMNLEAVGRRAAQLLLEALAGGMQPGVESIACHVVPRISTSVM